VTEERRSEEPGGAPSAGPADEHPERALILLPVRNMVLFPEVVLPLTVGRPKAIRAVQEAAREQLPVGIVLQRDAETEDPEVADLRDVGTVADILRYVAAEENVHHVICRGRQRMRVLEVLHTEPFLRARCELVEDVGETGEEVEARLISIKRQAREALEFLPGAPEELAAMLQGIKAPGLMADMIATFMDIEPAEKQEVLETLDVRARLELVGRKLEHTIEVLKLSQDIREQTKDTLDKAQREYFLRRQLETIRKELGEEGGEELQELTEAISKAGMPAEVEKEARKELARLERLPQAAAEYAMLRTYLETLVELPWSESTRDDLDLERAERILDEDHFGLQEVKKRILEFLAVRKLNPEGKGPILCLVGPPGTGKTSLGQSVARTLGRKFQRLSLGGVHDEAEIRGHRRTYIGALPGNIIQAIRKAGSNNPVLMLDEMDKLSAGFHGDPSSALLEVLDPEQNKAFRDSYLGVPFDLHSVFFIGTANVLDRIPGPLRDRCEVIELRGYTQQEKLEIAKRYLVRRQLEATGLEPEQCEIAEDAIREIIGKYTREAGCRGLERAIGSVCRHVATRVARGEVERVQVAREDLQAILGPPKYESEVAMRTSVPGVATGLAWTPVGGEILFIEATHMPGKGRLILTGQLGDVMKESAQAALSVVKHRAGELEIDPDLLARSDVHVHVPAGAIPKDGPSAGVTIYTALVSLFTERTVKADVAMTGEISLRGLVLPVGGIREKVLAALAAGVHTVLLPARNRKDLAEIPDEARSRLQFVWLETCDDAVRAALGPRAR